LSLIIYELALALFVSWVRTNHPHNAFATNNLAILTYTFYRTSDFHLSYLLLFLSLAAERWFGFMVREPV